LALAAFRRVPIRLSAQLSVNSRQRDDRPCGPYAWHDFASCSRPPCGPYKPWRGAPPHVLGCAGRLERCPSLQRCRVKGQMQQQSGSSAHASLWGFPSLALLALFGGHHVDIARQKRDLLAPALGASRLHGLMLGNGLGALKLLPAFLATILVSRHKLEPATRAAARFRILRSATDLEKSTRGQRPTLYPSGLCSSTSLTTSSAL
jgi:hypothetical protein